MNNPKYTVITGASSGIGYEAANAFAARGKNLIVTARRRDRLDALQEEIAELNSAVNVVIREADLSSNEETIALYESLKDYNIETWINNAGRGDHGDNCRTSGLRGGNPRRVDPGDVVQLAPGEKHRHGAAPTTAMSHIAVYEALDGKAVDRLEHVNDKQYRKGD